MPAFDESTPVAQKNRTYAFPRIRLRHDRRGASVVVDWLGLAFRLRTCLRQESSCGFLEPISFCTRAPGTVGVTDLPPDCPDPLSVR